MATINYISLHHAGGIANDAYAKTQHLTWQHIDNAHKERWDFKSTLGFYGGYSFFIMEDGTWKQFRAIGEETAAQVGYNFNCISICLAGNFIEKNGIRVEQPTEAQLTTLKKLIKQILDKDYTGIVVAFGTVVNVSLSSIHPHSFYQQTQCNCFPDAWGRDLMKDTTESIKPRQTAILGLIDSIILLIQKLRAEVSVLFSEKPLGGIDRGCNGMS